jgi:glycosyltransferase involved in cell wall biosynthesis
MKVRFIARMPPKGYSGGRLLALTYAEALGSVGVEVDFLTDHIPEMYEEFRPRSTISIRTCDLNNIGPMFNGKVDVTVIVPCLGDVPFHGEAVRSCLEASGRIILLNFETPNWFNQLSPFKRRVELWEGWSLVSRYSDMILSLSREGCRYAELYYKDAPNGCRFDYCHAAINSPVADEATSINLPQPTIVVLTRVDPHKGFNNLDALLCEQLVGFTVQVHLGTGLIDASLVSSSVRRFARRKMTLKVDGPIKGVRKFELLKSASALYFPTRFEGFGIPPLEAAYCRLPCACSNLPVLREFGGESLTYGEPDSLDSMRTAVMDALNSGRRIAEDYERIRKMARLEDCGLRLREQIGNIL